MIIVQEQFHGPPRRGARLAQDYNDSQKTTGRILGLSWRAIIRFWRDRL